MPVASSQKDAQNQLLQHYQHLLPKSPTYHLGGQLSPGSLVPNSEHYIGREEGATYVSDLRPLTALQASTPAERNASFFSTHSPPLINLSPNLSPTAEPQRVSPFYDLRETTRRRSFYDFQNSCNQPMQNPNQICSGIITEDASRKSESPSRKRRKTSNSYIDLTNHSPSPPPTWSRERTEAERLGVSRRRVSSQRRVSGDSRRLLSDRSNTPRARRRFWNLENVAMYPCYVASEGSPVMAFSSLHAETTSLHAETTTEGQNDETVFNEPFLWDSTFRSVVQLVVHCLLESAYARSGIPGNVGRDQRNNGQTFGHLQTRSNIRTGGDVHSERATTLQWPSNLSVNRTTVVLENQVYDVPPRGDYVSYFMRQLSQESQEIAGMQQTGMSMHRFHQYHPYRTSANLTARRRQQFREPRLEDHFTRTGDYPNTGDHYGNRYRWSTQRRRVPQQRDRLDSEPYNCYSGDRESSRIGGYLQQEGREAGRMREREDSIEQGEDFTGRQDSRVHSPYSSAGQGDPHGGAQGEDFTGRQDSRVNSPYPNAGQGDPHGGAGGFDRERGSWVGASPSDFVGRQLNRPGSLAELFNHLLQHFYEEAMMWIFVMTVRHPHQENLRNMLSIIADLVHEPRVSVATSMLQGFMTGISLSYDSQFQSVLEILHPLSGLDSLSSSTAAFLRIQSLMFNINLAPRQLLHRFSGIVMNAMTVMIQQHNAQIIDPPQHCPGTRRRARDRNSTPQNESAPEPRAFQPPHLMNSRQIHPASIHPHLHGGPQQVMFDMDQIPVSTPVSMAPYAIPVCAGPHLPVCTGAHHPVCSTAPTWSIPGCSVQLPSCNMQHIPACSLPQIPFHPSSIPPLFHHHHHHPGASHIPPQHIAPPTHFNASARGHTEDEVSGLIDQRSRFPLHPGTLHPHGATPFAASPPVMLQEPHVHPTPHDIYGPFQRHFARQRTGGRNGRLRSLPLPPPPYPGFLLHFLAMLGNPPMPYGRDFQEDATEVENYEALLNLAERLGEAKPKGLTKPEIEQLPAYRFNKENHHSDMDQTSCVVCMCDFENRQLLRVLPCSHEFHAKCVDKWLKTNRTCPICRADATEIASQSD